MGVTVQLMVDAEVSGVMFTCNPVSGDPSMVAVNASWGLGLAVVGGEVTPDDYLGQQGHRARSSRRHVHAKEVEYVPDDGGAAPSAVEVPDERRDAAVPRRRALEALVDVGRRVERHFGVAARTSSGRSREAASSRRACSSSSRVRCTAVPSRREQKPASAMSLLMSTFGAGVAGSDPNGSDPEGV